MLRVAAVLITLFALSSASVSWAARTVADPDRDIFILVRPGEVRLPTNSQDTPAANAVVRGIGLRGVLSEPSIQFVTRACPEAKASEARKVLSTGRIVHSMDLSNLFRVRVTDPTERSQVLARLSALPEVILAEANQRIALRSQPNDPSFRNQWNLQNVGQAGGTVGADIDAPKGWDARSGSPLVPVGVIDFDGPDGSHPEIAGRVTGTTGFEAHATAVAGIVGASGNNAAGMAGINWTCPIVSRTIAPTDAASAATAIRGAVDANCRVINLSWGLNSASDILGDAIAYAHQHQVLVVAAMPSVSRVGEYPNRYQNLGVMNTGATANLNVEAPYTVPAWYIDVCAPGGNQDGVPERNIYSLNAYGGYQWGGGTSWAAPHVTGAAALLYDYANTNFPGLGTEAEDLRGIIRATADDIRDPGFDSYTGFGRLNLRRMFQWDPYAGDISGVLTSVGGTDLGPSGLYTMRIYNEPTLMNNPYYPNFLVKLHGVTKTVSVPGTASPTRIWGLGSSTGWPGVGSDEPSVARALFNTGWCSPTSITTSGVTLQTYVYQVFNPLGAYLGWYPCEPSQVVFRFREFDPTPHASPSTAIDATQSYFVPEAGSVATPTVGSSAVAFFRACPNNDGGASLPNNARIRIVVRDASGVGVPNIDAADIAIVFNGGTAAQGFSGSGADSIIANSAWNAAPLCPDVRVVTADAPTDANGQTYITFAGTTPGSPGVATRDPLRKWGHYDSELPVYVLGMQVQGRLTTGDVNGSYILRIKNFDLQGGLAAAMNQGELVSSVDINTVANHVGVNDALSYWCDFDGNGSVGSTDVNMINAHATHDCDSPNNP